MKSIKYLNKEHTFLDKINSIRQNEYNWLFGIRALDGMLAVFWNSISYFLLFAFLVTFISDGH